jgi:hypothetical protein
MDVLRFDGGFTMISSIQHVFFMGKHPQVLWWCFFFAKHIVEHLDFNVRFNSDFCEKSSSLMMVKKWVFIMNLRILNGNLPCIEVVNSN